MISLSCVGGSDNTRGWVTQLRNLEREGLHPDCMMSGDICLETCGCMEFMFLLFYI